MSNIFGTLAKCESTMDNWRYVNIVFSISNSVFITYITKLNVQIVIEYKILVRFYLFSWARGHKKEVFF